MASSPTSRREAQRASIAQSPRLAQRSFWRCTSDTAMSSRHGSSSCSLMTSLFGTTGWPPHGRWGLLASCHLVAIPSQDSRILTRGTCRAHATSPAWTIVRCTTVPTSPRTSHVSAGALRSPLLLHLSTPPSPPHPLSLPSPLSPPKQPHNEPDGSLRCRLRVNVCDGGGGVSNTRSDRRPRS